MRISMQKVNFFSLFTILFYVFGSSLLSIPLSYIENPTLESLVIYTILFLLPSLLYIVISKGSFRDTLSIKPMNFVSILLVIAFSITIQPFMMLISAITNLFFTNVLDETLFQLSDIPFPLLLITLAVIPAIFEEIPTRGVLLSGYKDEDIDIKIAALINGLFFGALHLNFQQFFYAFALGFLFVYLVRLTGSILSSILAHFIINGSQVLLFKIQTEPSPMMNVDANAIVNTLDNTQLLLIAIVSALIFALLFTPLAILCIYLLGKVNNKTHLLTFKFKEGSRSILFGKQMIPFYIAIIIFIIMGIILEAMKNGVL